MKKVVVPVSPLTRKILLAYHGPEPLRPSEHDLLTKHLRYRGKKERRQQLRQHTLTTSITFQVGDDLAGQINAYSEGVGMYLHTLHKREIFQDVYTEVLKGEEALGSLKNILDSVNVSEDDFSLESAYRLYKRWKVKKSKKEVNTISGEYVPLGCSLYARTNLSFRQADHVANRVLSLCDNGAIKIDGRLKIAIRRYIQYTYTSNSLRSLAKILNYSSKGTLGRSIRFARSYLEENPKLHRSIAYCIKSMEVKPVPTAS